MEQLNRIITTLLLVFGVQSYSGNSMQLYRRIVRQYGHPPFEQIILKPSYQLIHPHRPYHPIIKFDETPVHSNPHIYHHYDPSFNQQQLFHPIPNPNLFQPVVVQPTKPKPPPPSQSKITEFYIDPSNYYIESYNQHKLQNPYFQTSSQPQPIRYSKPKTKPDYEYHNPSQHYIPQPHHHHQRFQNAYDNDETPPPSRQITKDHNGASGKETSTKHVTNIESIKTMPQREQINKDEDEEPLERPDVSKTTGPVFTYVKTDPHANIKWGVRHYVGNKYN